jgi:hypothetical protein
MVKIGDKVEWTQGEETAQGSVISIYDSVAIGAPAVTVARIETEPDAPPRELPLSQLRVVKKQKAKKRATRKKK